jgi:RHS repeat-associated protein
MSTSVSLTGVVGRGTIAALALFAGAGSAAAQGAVEYYHLDALGSVRAVTNQAGTVIERHDYLAFGEECTTPPCSTAEPGTNSKKFTGKERDVESGLDYFGARYYGSKVGRFTSVDPVLDLGASSVEPQRWNRYSYSLGNPLRYVDPDGRNPIIIQRALQLAERAFNSPLGQRLRDFAATQGANAWMAVMATLRGANSPAGQDALQAGVELASGSQSLGSATPILYGNAENNTELFREAFGHLLASTGTAGEKADLWESLSAQMTYKTSGSWVNSRHVAEDGADFFVGGRNQIIVIDTSGRIFRGDGDALTYRAKDGGAVFSVNYDKLTERKAAQ